MDELLGQVFCSLRRSFGGGSGGSRAVDARAATQRLVPPATVAVFSPTPARATAAEPRAESPIDLRRPAIPKRPTSEPQPAGEAAPPIAPWAQQFRSPQGLLGAIVAGEVLGPPKALR